jgi:hypothetical protein
VKITSKSYSRLPKSLGWIANAANSNLLPRALHTIHFISKATTTTTTTTTAMTATSKDE